MSNDLTPEQMDQMTAYPILEYFKWAHLPQKLQMTSQPFAVLAWNMAKLPQHDETTAGLRHLLEAKDCAVRSALC